MEIIHDNKPDGTSRISGDNLHVKKMLSQLSYGSILSAVPQSTATPLVVVASRTSYGIDPRSWKKVTWEIRQKSHSYL